MCRWYWFSLREERNREERRKRRRKRMRGRQLWGSTWDRWMREGLSVCVCEMYWVMLLMRHIFICTYYCVYACGDGRVTYGRLFSMLECINVGGLSFKHPPPLQTHPTTTNTASVLRFVPSWQPVGSRGEICHWQREIKEVEKRRKGVTECEKTVRGWWQRRETKWSGMNAAVNKITHTRTNTDCWAY